MRNLMYIAILLLAALNLSAQQEVFKVSKQMNRNFNNEVKSIKLSGEKASISIEGWNNDFTEVQIRQVSRNEAKKTAESDLRYIKVFVEMVGETLVLKNYFEGNADIISSNLSVEYFLKVPTGIAIQLMDLYGKVELKHLNNAIDAEVSFGSLEMESIEGSIKINGKYSTLTGKGVAGGINLFVDKCEVNLESIRGNVTVDSKYGEISIGLLSDKFPVAINSKRSKVVVTLPEGNFNYNLKNQFSEIEVPGLPIIKNGSYIKNSGELNSSITITTSYCPIIIRKR